MYDSLLDAGKDYGVRNAGKGSEPIILHTVYKCLLFLEIFKCVINCDVTMIDIIY